MFVYFRIILKKRKSLLMLLVTFAMPDSRYINLYK